MKRRRSVMRLGTTLLKVREMFKIEMYIWYFIYLSKLNIFSPVYINRGRCWMLIQSLHTIK